MRTLTTLLLVAAVALLPTARGRAAPATRDTVLLRVNRFWLSYLHPAAPHVRAGRVRVPLRSFCDAMGIGLKVPPGAGEARLTLDGRVVSLPLRGEMKEGAHIVPLAEILNALEIPYTWDGPARTLTVRDGRLMGTPFIVSNPQTYSLEEHIHGFGPERSDIVAVGLTVERGRERRTGRPFLETRVRVRNASGRGLGAGEFEPIFLTVGEKGLTFSGTLVRPTVDFPYKPFRAVAPGEVFVLTDRQTDLQNDPVRYTVLLLRTRERAAARTP